MTRTTVGVEADSVVIAVDPHKGSWTAVAVDRALQPQGTIRVDVDEGGYRRLRRFARQWPQADWAIEGAAGPGAPLSRRLHAVSRTVPFLTSTTRQLGWRDLER